MKIENKNIAETVNNKAESSTQAQIYSAQGVTKRGLVSLSPGDSFSATVKDITPNNVVLKLQDGTELNAKSLIMPDAHIGDKAIFIVTENFKGQILLELLKPDPSDKHSSVLREALEAAGLPVTDENKQIVKALMENGLPLDKETLRNAAFFKYSNAKIDIDKMIFLINENFPANEKTISIINSLITSGSTPNSGIMKLGDKLDELIKNILPEQGLQADINMPFLNKKEFIEDIINILLKTRQNGKTPDANTDTNTDTDINVIRSNAATDNGLKRGIDRLDNTNTNVNANIVVENAVKLLKQRFFADLNAVSKDGSEMKQFFERMSETMDEIKAVVQKHEGSIGSSENKLINMVENIKDNILFMSKIQNSKEYFQIPFSINGKENTGEIHIFKESGKAKNLNENASILIALDYAALGHIEIFINKAYRQISLQFRADTDTALKIIGHNAYNLARALNEKGYQVSQIAYKQMPERFDAAMIPKELKPKREQHGRYSFDIRV